MSGMADRARPFQARRGEHAATFAMVGEYSRGLSPATAAGGQVERLPAGLEPPRSRLQVVAL
jgi:hypothetical protein